MWKLVTEKRVFWTITESYLPRLSLMTLNRLVFPFFPFSFSLSFREAMNIYLWLDGVAFLFFNTIFYLIWFFYVNLSSKHKFFDILFSCVPCLFYFTMFLMKFFLTFNFYLQSKNRSSHNNDGLMVNTF